MQPKHEHLASGKTIIREFDAEGNLRSETHQYDMLTIGLKMEFIEGVKSDEMYFLKRRAVSRARYEKARAEYPDMPPADTSLPDSCGELAKLAAGEQRMFRERAKASTPRPADAARIDSFCRDMMADGQRADAVTWVKSSTHNLGELSNRASRGLVSKLARLGCRQIYACKIDSDEEGFENTGHLVVELPTEPTARQEVFREIGKIAAKQGFTDHHDAGQSHAYLMLD
jgi:hypothetical protein